MWWWPTGAGAGALLTVALAAAIVAFLVVGVASGPLSWWELLTSSTWDPSRGRFGAASMIWGTAAVTAVALVIAVPVGRAAAVAINELAPPGWRRALRAGAELLAVVPSIVFGLVAIAYVRPLVARVAGVPGGDSLLAAGIVLAVMVLPTIVAVSIDALAGVPGSQREAATACGLTRSEVIRSAVLPQARRGLRAAVLLALARALGETIAVFLVVGRADGRMPSDIVDGLAKLVRPGQTLTTKLNGPESLLAGTSGAHWAALCGVGLVLLAAVALLSIVGRRGTRGEQGGASAPNSPRHLVRPWRELLAGRTSVGARSAVDRVARGGWWVALAITLCLVVGIAAVVGARGVVAFDPSFWWSQATGASGGGIRNQVAGTVILVAGAGALAAPLGLGLGLVISEYARRGWSRRLRTLTLTLAGVPSILLGLWGYWLFAVTFGWGRSWLAGAVVLAVVALPPTAVSVASAVSALPTERREAALAAGLRRDQLVRSVLVPRAMPGLVTGLLLGLARAAGETAPLLFTAAVFSGAPMLPEGIRQSPVATLPTHIFTLAQDAAEPAAVQAAWGAAVALVVIAGLLALAAVPARRRMETAG